MQRPSLYMAKRRFGENPVAGEDPNPISEEYLRQMFRRVEKTKMEDIFIEEDTQISKEARPSDLKQPKASVPEKLIHHEKIEFVDEARNVIKTQYGNLQIPPFYMNKYNRKLSNLYYLSNSTKTNFIRKIFKEDKNGLMLFVPDANYHNVRNLFDSVVKKISEFYFKEESIKHDFRINEHSTEEAKQIYNDTIRKMIDMRKFLSRVVIVVNSDCTLRNENAPDLKIALKTYLDNTGILDFG